THQDMLPVPDPTQPNLGWGVGAGSYRLSPHALNLPERFGPLTNTNHSATPDPYVSGVFKTDVPYQQGNFLIHKGYYDPLHERPKVVDSLPGYTSGMAGCGPNLAPQVKLSRRL